MERVKLTKSEKTVLRMVAGGIRPKEFPTHIYTSSVMSLEHIGLVKAYWGEEGGLPVDTELTDHGAMYLAENPGLHNPIDWKWVVTIGIAAIAAITGVAALFIACGTLK